MQTMIRQASHLFSHIFAKGASLAMSLLFLIVFINSVRRYTIGKSFEWGEELPVFITIYGVVFGVAWAYLQDKHIRFTMLVGFLPDSFTNKLYIFVDLCMIITSGLLSYSGWLFVIKRGGLESPGLINLAKQIKAATGMDSMIWIGHLYPYQAAMMIGGGMLFIAAVLRLLTRFSNDLVTESSGG